jgi:hypothetical protein
LFFVCDDRGWGRFGNELVPCLAVGILQDGRDGGCAVLIGRAALTKTLFVMSKTRAALSHFLRPKQSISGSLIQIIAAV